MVEGRYDDALKLDDAGMGCGFNGEELSFIIGAVRRQIVVKTDVSSRGTPDWCFHCYFRELTLLTLLDFPLFVLFNNCQYGYLTIVKKSILSQLFVQKCSCRITVATTDFAILFLGIL